MYSKGRIGAVMFQKYCPSVPCDRQSGWSVSCSYGGYRVVGQMPCGQARSAGNAAMTQLQRAYMYNQLQ